jgi:GTP-binding protein
MYVTTAPNPLGPTRSHDTSTSLSLKAAFIGRSNVGKSSLINMISNRKGIAFVSKTPGKTSEFNYFDAKGRVGMKNEKHRFYLVDLPGVGYAEVRKELRASWLVLLRDYVVNRETLRIVFHLIDSRHGILDTDEDCLSLLEVLPEHVQYVIVLTKVDKHNTGVRRDVLERIANVVKQRTDRQVRSLS